MKKKTVLITVLVVVLVCFTWHISVQAQNENGINLTNKYYREIEELYKENLRDKLTAMGYKNAGITLTRVYLDNGKREYTGLIHHQRIDRMTGREKDELLEELAIVHLQVKDCIFQEEILSY